MLISNKRNFIFVHVPKVAGTSVRKVLSPFCKVTNYGKQKHASAASIREMFPKEFADYYTFAIVRNPWDWEVSAYFYIRQASFHVYHDEVMTIDFKEYIKRRHMGKYDVMPHNLAWWVTDANGKLIVDGLFFFEDLKSTYAALRKRLKMPELELQHHNRTRHQPYWTYYDDEAERRVAEVHRQDIKLFDYTFRSK